MATSRVKACKHSRAYECKDFWGCNFWGCKGWWCERCGKHVPNPRRSPRARRRLGG